MRPGAHRISAESISLPVSWPVLEELDVLMLDVIHVYVAPLEVPARIILLLLPAVRLAGLTLRDMRIPSPICLMNATGGGINGFLALQGRVVRVLLRRASSCHIFGHHCSHHIVTQLVVHWAGHETRINLPSHSQSTLLPVSRPVSGIRTLTVRKRSLAQTAFAITYLCKPESFPSVGA